MLNFHYRKDHLKEEAYIETMLTGKQLLMTTLLNKGTAFSAAERDIFKLHGKLPYCIETLEQQVKRTYAQYSRYTIDLSKNIYLNDLRDRNETLFYALLKEHVDEMLPVIYTPIVGDAVKAYSREFRAPRGLYLSYPDRGRIREILKNRSHPDVDLIVVTDGGGVLGIGDQGIGAIDIPIAKLMLYSLFGGIFPGRTLPITLDVGTNNVSLLNDPYYLGWRHERITDSAYDEFVDEFIEEVKREHSHVFLHWEDLGQRNAQHVLKRYKDHICTFNDDIQGTGAVVVSSVLSAVQAKGERLTDQRIVLFGAGTAGIGIVEQLHDAMVRSGASDEQARKCFWLLDRPGLLMKDIPGLTEGQQRFARSASETVGWERGEFGMIGLTQVVNSIKPTILIGCSAVPGAFNESVIRLMHKSCPRPIIMPLSNPTERAEATPDDLIRWTQGDALIATGSPFAPVCYEDKTIPISQCNNALVFPGIGAGILAVKAKKLTDEMLWAACQAICKFSPIESAAHPDALLPSLKNARSVSKAIAIAVANVAREQGLDQSDHSVSVEDLVHYSMWEPHYLPFEKVDEV